MSFKPDTLPPAAGAAGKRFYLLHSPQDFIKTSFPEDARAKLSEAGAKVERTTYEGGHGRHGDVFALLRDGFEWLNEKAE